MWNSSTTGALIGLFLFVTGCNVRNEPTSSMKDDPLPLPPATATEVRKIFENKCYTCHGDDSIGWGGMTYVTDLSALVANGKVVRGSPEQQATSPLLQRVISVDKPMPPVVDPLDDTGKKAITDWIMADSPLTDAQGGEHPLAAAAKVTLEKSCGSCHGATAPGTGEGLINYITDLAKLVQKNKVKRGDEATRKKSRVLIRINSADNPMPPLVAPLEAGEIDQIRSWVLSNSPGE